MKISEFLEQVRDDMSEMDAFFALLEIAAKLKLVTHNGAIMHYGRRAALPETLHLLEGAANALNGTDRETRFRTISTFLDQTTDRMTGEFWIRKAACDQVLNLIDRAMTVRFAYSCGFRPCLTYAYLNDAAGKRVRLIFCSNNADHGHLMQNLLDVLDIGVSVSIETAWPFARTEKADSEVEVIFPPLASSVPDIDHLPHATMVSIGFTEKKSGRLSMESIAIADALEHTSGRAIVSVSDGALFRMVGSEPIARRNLVDSGRLQAVMSIPSGLMFTSTGIKTNLVIISEAKDPQAYVSFGDLGHKSFSHMGQRGRCEIKKGVDWNRFMFSDIPADKTLLRDVNHDEIHANNFVLTPNRYLNVGAKERLEHFLATANADEQAELADLVDMVRPTSLTQDDGGEYTLHEASPADLNQRGFIGLPSRSITVDRAKYNKAFNQQLRTGDVLLSIKGNVGVVAMVPADIPTEGETEIWTAGQSMMILRPKKRVSMSSLALFEYLSNATVQEFLKSLAGGTGIQNLAMTDLKSFPVIMPDAATMAAVEAGFAERQVVFDDIEALKKQLLDLRDRRWPHSQLKPDN